MPKILINYKQNKDGSFKLYLNQEYVFADMSICIADLDYEYTEPIVVNINNQPMVVEKEEYEKSNKLYYLKTKGDKVYEDKDGSPMYLPKNVDISKLRYINNQIVLVEEQEEEEK